MWITLVQILLWSRSVVPVTVPWVTNIDLFKQFLDLKIFILNRIKKLVKMVTVVEGDLKAPFSTATTPTYTGESTTPFPGLLHFTIDTYLILQSVKQGGIKYHF